LPSLDGLIDAPALPPSVECRAPRVGRAAGPLAAGHSPPEPTHLDRGQILQATATCLRELGYDGTTIRRIAGLLGCAVGSIYRYFNDKRALLDAVAQGRFEPVAAAAESRQPIDASVRLYALTALADPSTYRMMFWLAGGPDGTAATLPAVTTRIVAAWERRLNDGERARRCWMLVHGAVMMGQSADHALALVQRLLAAKPAPKPAMPPSEPSSTDGGQAAIDAEDVCLL